ncbi:hypothetical protein MVEG_11364 [Podila verticillata NRRL 6337]|uniref:Uncharacterized protein n=1 Tax=Podila verticillata NRRL 6337 TaxID=1069443 RepID=A0A086TLL2_9FUNG|nr:hypothetical protein MVEG_11364 [Podila verticillata NRRL 6337]
MATIQLGAYPVVDANSFSKLNAEVFAGLDLRSKTYRPWECEAILENLHVKIVDIPIKLDDDEGRRLPFRDWCTGAWLAKPSCRSCDLDTRPRMRTRQARPLDALAIPRWSAST